MLIAEENERVELPPHKLVTAAVTSGSGSGTLANILHSRSLTNVVKLLPRGERCWGETVTTKHGIQRVYL